MRDLRGKEQIAIAEAKTGKTILLPVNAHYPFAAEVKEQLEQQKMQQLQQPMQPQAQESALPRANATDTLTQDSGGDTMNMLGGMI